jgi:Tfp pilus assembly protein PilO
MTTRERSLAIVLVAVLGVFGLGFVGYQFVLSPLLDKNRQINARKAEIAQLETDIMSIQVEKKKFEAARQQSLPADVGVAREQYGNLLEKVCRRSELTNELKIIQSDPDNKSVPMLAPKKPAYTRLTYKLTAKGELYHLVDFMRLFYQLPLLHTIKAMNIQRPSEARARDRRELDIDLTIEALVLDAAPDRGTLLPVVRELALLGSSPAVTGFNLQVVATGKGDPVPPTGVLSESSREYLAVAGKDVFFGPLPKKEERDKREEDISQFVFLASVTGHEDGSCVAAFRDKLNNTDYLVTQGTDGKLLVETLFEVKGTRKTLRKGQEIIYGTDEGRNLRAWRVRRICATDNAVIVEKADRADKPKPHPAALIGGGPGAFVAVAEGATYKVAVGQCLDPYARGEGRSPPPPSKLEPREAWRAIFAPPVVAPTTTVSTDDGGK